MADRLKQSVKSKVNMFLFSTIHSNETSSAAYDTVVLSSHLLIHRKQKHFCMDEAQNL